jgi:hypothetical protein
MELGALPFEHELVREYLSVFEQQEPSDSESSSSSSSSSSDEGGNSEEDLESRKDPNYGGTLTYPQAYGLHLIVSSAGAHPPKRVKRTA